MKRSVSHCGRVFCSFHRFLLIFLLCGGIQRIFQNRITAVKLKIIRQRRDIVLWQKTGEIDFYTVKGIMEKLFEELEISKRIKLQPLEKTELAKTHAIHHPYKTAVIMLLGKTPTAIGYFGQIHPILKDKLKLNQDAFIFKLNLDEVISIIKERVPRYKKLPQFPEVRRDLAFVINQNVTFDDIQKVIKGSIQQNIFKGSEVFDVYQGEHIQDGYKSVAFRIKMQDENATLTDEIIDKQMNALRDKLKKTYADISFRE